jgi:uncharacterized protein (TIGR03083 family)
VLDVGTLSARVLRVDAGTLYRATRLRLTDLLSGISPSDWRTPVPACPGWNIKAVVAHLVANVEDALAGRLTGPPSEAHTAEQVARHADNPPGLLVDTWNDAAPLFEPTISRLSIWPAAIDALTHEQDVRGAIGRPGDRLDDAFHIVAHLLLADLKMPMRMTFDLGREQISTAGSAGPAHEVITSAFEITRLRLGRRSRDQVLAMPWRPPLPSVPDELFVFGPRATALIE